MELQTSCPSGERLMPSMRRPAATARFNQVAIALILLCTALVYLPGLQGPLLLDDRPNLTDNQMLHIDGAMADEWRTAMLSSDAGRLGRPVSMLTFAINYVAAGEFSPAALKATNVAIHLLVGLLIYWLATRLARAPALPSTSARRANWLALAAMAIWLLHPLHVSTVLYAVQRMAQLSTLFVVLGLCVYVHYRQRWVVRRATPGELVAAALWLSLITGLAGLSKENGLLLPWLVLVLEVSLYCGYWAGQRSRPLAVTAWCLLLCPFLLLALCLLLYPDFILGAYRHRDFDLQQRLLTQGRVLWHYLGWIVWPDVRSMGFQHDDIALSANLWQPLTTVSSLAAWALLLACSILWRHRFPLLLCAVLFYLVGHFLESGVFALDLVYEHRNYLPSIGVCLLLAAVLASARVWRGPIPGSYLCAGVLALLALLLLVRSYTWSDQLLMMRSNVQHHPNSPRARFAYGETLFDRHERRAELGLDDERAGALMVEARQQFASVYANDPHDIGAQVMLFIIDSRYFPVLAEREAWLGVLRANLAGLMLTPSDVSAIKVLVKYVLEQGTDADRRGLLAILDDLTAAPATRSKLLLQKYTYLAATGAPGADRLAVLQQKLRYSPASFAAQYYRVIEHTGDGDIAEAYIAIQDWLARDAARQHLSLMKSLFQAQPQ